MTDPVKKSKWEEYKERLGETRPWDLLNPAIEFVPVEISTARYEICKACPELINITKQCKQCGCFMAQKTKLPAASCPIHKW
jgi:hypothetical protein